ncbi:RDD family protein [Streptomyces sp. NPDC059832]|uniref:RDD family protein n=1 Tax=Streptomyces sp. NPDC059832 TaxID=3346966 RepID=UPI00364A78DE
MSAPTPAPGDESPREGYYPDPSIPGYVRYWNGASWVPGTSRPAPQQGESMPVAPSGAEPSAPAAEPESQPQPLPAVPAPVDETGPVFLDEEPHAANRPEPATAWQADASRQTGFGGERDRRVSWGGPGRPDEQGGQGEQARPSGPEAGAGTEPGHDPRMPADLVPVNPVPVNPVPVNPVPAARVPDDRAPAVRAPADRAPADPRRPAAASPSSEPADGALPGARDAGGQVPEHTVAIRVGPRPARRAPEPAATEGTMAIRAIAPGAGAQAPAPAPAQNPAPAPAQNPAPWTQQSNPPAQPQLPAQQHQPQLQPQPQLQLQLPVQQHQPPPQQPRPQFGAQGAQGAQPDQPVVPWKPPVDDPFQQLAQAQAAARPAGLGKRFAARLIDTVVLLALVGGIGFPLVSQALDHIDEKINAAKLSGETVTVWLVDSTTAGLFGGVLGAFLVLGVLLEALPTAKWGRTLGKKLCGLEVRDIESHGAPAFGAALRRWLVYGVLGVLVIGVVNVLWCLFDRPWRQCWHDKAAHTFVAG